MADSVATEAGGEFRLAPGGVARAQLNVLLWAARTVASQLCWESFRRRETLGLPLDGAGPQRYGQLVQRRGAKRRRVCGLKEASGGKRPRSNIRVDGR